MHLEGMPILQNCNFTGNLFSFFAPASFVCFLDKVVKKAQR